MHVCLQVLTANLPHDYSPQEEEKVRSCVASAPGVERLKTISRHPKGGYSVTMDHVGAPFDPMFEHIQRGGYLLVF